jgi:hypothetical protein
MGEQVSSNQRRSGVRYLLEGETGRGRGIVLGSALFVVQRGGFWAAAGVHVDVRVRGQQRTGRTLDNKF